MYLRFLVSISMFIVLSCILKEMNQTSLKIFFGMCMGIPLGILLYPLLKRSRMKDIENKNLH